VWQEAVFALYLAAGKIEAEVVENMRSWEHTGFSVEQSVFLPAGDQQGIESRRAGSPLHDPLSFQSVSAGQGDPGAPGGR
jgi:hypothetical protein